MPWQEVSTVSLRAEFVALANQERANVRRPVPPISDQSADGVQMAGAVRA